MENQETQKTPSHNVLIESQIELESKFDSLKRERYSLKDSLTTLVKHDELKGAPAEHREKLKGKMTAVPTSTLKIRQFL